MPVGGDGRIGDAVGNGKAVRVAVAALDQVGRDVFAVRGGAGAGDEKPQRIAFDRHRTAVSSGQAAKKRQVGFLDWFS